MSLALPNASGDCFALTPALLEKGFRASAESPRLRMILPIHRKQEATVQRMLNFFQPGTYICPHRHPENGAIETIQVLNGALGFLLFHPNGNLREKFTLKSDGCGLVDIEPGVWHGMVALEPNTVILEIKQGPGSMDRTPQNGGPG
ncbi:MAG: WbuC family cupin fold metalloprotein, partial [Verrucomicrobiota bacterium]